MSYFDGIFLVNDVYQYRLREAWPVNGYADVIPSQIDPLFNLTKFATTGSFSTQLNQYGIDLTVLYPFNADTSTNKFEVTVFGDTKAANFNPYTPGYYSAYFDGTGDYLTVPGNSSFALGTGDFTLEVWLYANSISTGTFDRICATSDYNGSGFDWTLNTSTSAFYLAGTSYNIGSITTKVWHHLVYTRSGSVIRGFLNGNLSSYTTGASQNVSSVTQLNIGTGYSGTALNGYLSNLRIIKGSIPSAYQTSSTTTGTQIFTSPTTPLTAIANTSLLACQSNRFIDNSPNNFAITVNGNTAINPTNPFTVPSSVAVNNFYSTSFDGIGDYLTVPANAAFAPGTGDFTVEGWFNAFDLMTSASGIIYGQAVAGTNYFMIFATNGVVQFYGTLSGGGSPISSGANNWTLGTWNHFAVVRNSGSVTVYLNGIAGTAIADTNNYTDTSYIPTIGRYTHVDSNLFFGSISNLRYVKGTAVYTSNFTPPTTPLTAIAGTSLLTCQSPTFIDNSTNNFAITSFGQAQPIPQSPFTQTTTSVSTTYLGSSYFDGTGDYLVVPNSSNALNFGTGDFTAELWFYPTAFTADAQFLDFRAENGAAWGTFYFTNSDKRIAFYDGTVYNATSQPLTLNSWNHVVLCRASGTLKMFVNGIQAYSATHTGSYNGNKVTIGAHVEGSFAWPTGYISNLRLINGTALYRTNFAVPQSPLTAVTNTSLLTLQTNQPHNNTTFLDKSNNKFLITRVGNTTQGTFSPYNGSWSNYFDGDGDYLTVPSNAAFGFGTGDFTIEGWFNFTGTIGTYQRPWWFGDDNENLEINSSVIRFGGASLTTITGPTAIGKIWYHIAYSRQSGSGRLFVNGVQVGSTTASSYNSSARTFTLMATSAGANPSAGYVSNFRIVKGTALYTSAFTPPTAPLTITSGSSLLTSNSTSVLTCQSNRFIDSSTNNFTITRNGDVSVSSESPFSKAYTHPVPTSYSGYFDGTGDYLVTPASSALALATNAADFTMECWVYNNGGAGSQYGRGICVYYPSGGYGSNRLMFRLIGGENRINLYLLANSSAELGSPGTDGTATITLNAWTHVALVRNAGVFYVYVNGVLDITVNSSSAASSIPFTTFNTIEVGRTQDGSSPDWNGYISNYRFVKGTAVYTSAFTPPTAPLTAITNTSLLTCQSPTFIDNSTNAFAITVNGDAKPTTVNPFGSSQTLTDYTPNVYGGSGYFDGTGDSLTVPHNASLTPSGDFTIEFWAYPTVTSLQEWYSKGDGIQIFTYNSTWNIALSSSNNTTYFLSSSFGSVQLNTWQHIALYRIGTAYYASVNGIVTSMGTSASAPNTGTSALLLGAYAGYDAAGYMSDVRFVNGNSVYLGSNFAPPLAPVTAVANTSLLLNFTDAAIKDYTMRSNMETMADLKVSSANSKFGGTSLYFDGTGDYGNISPVSNTLILGTGDFTAEMWINPYSNITTTYPMTIGSEAAGGYSIILINGTLNVNLFGGATANLTLNGPRIPANAWSHIAVVREAGNVRGYYNGNVLPNTQVNSSIIGNGPLRLGSNGLGTSNFFGYMDDVRITANARYTANFIPAITYLPTR